MVVHTPTQAEYNWLMEYLESKGYRWFGGILLTDINNWVRYKDKTCINISNTLSYSYKSYFEERDYTILSLQEYKQKEDIMEFQKGDIVRLRKDCTLGELIDNDWNGCQGSTIKLIRENTKGNCKEYKIEKIKGNVVYIDGWPISPIASISPIALELVNRPTKELTMNEIAEKFGIPVEELKIRKD